VKHSPLKSEKKHFATPPNYHNIGLDLKETGYVSEVFYTGAVLAFYSSYIFTTPGLQSSGQFAVSLRQTLMSYSR